MVDLKKVAELNRIKKEREKKKRDSDNKMVTAIYGLKKGKKDDKRK